MPEDETTNIATDGSPTGEMPPIAMSVEDLYRSALASEEDTETEEPEAEPDPEPVVDVTDDEQPEGLEPAEEEPDPAPVLSDEERITDHLNKIAQNPARINEVPGRERGEVLKRFAMAMYQAGQNVATEMVTQREAQMQQIREFVANRDEERRDDPEAFLAWSDEHPDQAQAYWQARQLLNGQVAPQPQAPQPQPQQQAPPPQDDPESIQEQANALGQRMAQLPEAARQHIQQRLEAGEFQRTAAGLAALQSAVATAEQLSTGPAAERQAAAERRNGTARAHVEASGGPTPNENPIRHINDPEQLFERALAKMA